MHTYIRVSILEYFQSVFHFKHPSHWQSNNKDIGNEDSHVIDKKKGKEILSQARYGPEGG